MKDVTITVYDKTNSQIIDQFVSDFEDMNEMLSQMENILHDYDVPYFELGWHYEIY